MQKLSYQLYSSREFPPISDTLKMLASLGYAQVEAYSGLFGDLAGLKAGLKDNGLEMPSFHVGLDQLEGDPVAVLDAARLLGVTHVFCPHIMPDQRPGDAAGWKAFGERLERAGQPFRDAGLGFGWHNHDFEFVALPDGSAPMEHILAGGPTLEWEADIAWIVRGGGDPFDWIARHGDRITGVHVKDIAPAGQNQDEDGWADVGHGTMDWKKLLDALKGTNAEIFVMEHDKPNDHARFARRSIEAVRGFQE